MQTVTAAKDDSRPMPIAPWWHTSLLVLLFLTLALGGALFQLHAATESGALQHHSSKVPLYISLLVMEWGLVLYVRKGLILRGFKLRELIGSRRGSAAALAKDMGLAIAFG
jgi:hypothetical protein